MADELNRGLAFGGLEVEQRASFNPAPVPLLVRFETGAFVFKWTDYTSLRIGRKGYYTEYWSPWDSFTAGGRSIRGFAEMRKAFPNENGGVGRPQEAARALNAVTEQWNGMRSILKAQFLKPVWGFVGRARHQRKYLDPGDPGTLDNVYFIGGADQVVIPNLTGEWIRKV